MSSEALRAFDEAIAEVSDLSMVSGKLGKSKASSFKALRVAGRGRVILASSHFERYIYAINEEAVAYLNSISVPSRNLPTLVKLLHASPEITKLGETNWERRDRFLEAFVSTDGWLWQPNGNGQLQHDRLLIWMKAPTSKNLVRYYKYWGVEDIFTSITRNKATRGRLYYGIQELVDKRNDIAHGNFNVQVTKADTQRYIKSAKEFCRRADNALATALMRISSGARPW